ncbi:MAG TPA: DUF417 family protein, partial [Vicinamibacteria bacterium]|nr:DUF417 family protein [Vicinamibacteria bacterium]
GESILRYGLVLLILWFGAFKFTRAEAEAIQPLLANSPLLSWVYELASIEGASRMIGSAEIAIALLIALRPVWPNLSLLGSLGAIGMFLSTLSFLVTTPGMWAWVEGILVPSAAGAFIVKDVILLGAASWTAGEALTAYERRKTDRWAGSSVDFSQSRELAR